jgi:hypothetical protein
MHPDVRGRIGDRCPICHMTLVAMAADYSPYWWEFSSGPSPVPGQRTRLRFRIHAPRSGGTVLRFESVHERILHFFVIGNNLEFFAHLHPDLQRDGWFTQDVRLPRAGSYRLIADFLPAGGPPQLLMQSILTRGFDGPLLPVGAPAEQMAPVTVGGLTVSLDATPPVAGREQLLTIEVHDARGTPVTDLEPFLGASGHLLVVSADLQSAFHSHPVAGLSPGLGPRIVFQALFPRPGTYRLWFQIQRNGSVLTVPFTVRASPRDQVLSK